MQKSDAYCDLRNCLRRRGKRRWICASLSARAELLPGRGSRFRPRMKRRTPASPSTGSNRAAFSVASPVQAAWIARVTLLSCTTLTTTVFPTRERVVATLRAGSAGFF